MEVRDGTLEEEKEMLRGWLTIKVNKKYRLEHKLEMQRKLVERQKIQEKTRASMGQNKRLG